jgi:hypothetical protein
LQGIDEPSPRIDILATTIDILGKCYVFKMRLISILNIHSPSSLPFDRLRRVQYEVAGFE